MRKFVWLYIFILLTTLLAACGSSSTTRQVATTQTTAVPTTDSSRSSTLTISAHLLPTQTPAQPTPTTKATGGNGTNSGNKGTGTGSSGGNGSGSDNAPSALEQQLLQTINQDRTANNLPAYIWEARLQKSGYQHNLVMAGGCGLSHQCSGEASLGTRINNQGVSWSSCGENIGTGGPVQASSSSQWSLVSTLHKDMMGEQPPDDGHRKNLLSNSFRRIGISIYVDAKDNLWLTEDFAS